MIAASSPTVPWGSNWDPYDQRTATAAAGPYRVEVIITYGGGYASNDPEPKKLPWGESPWARRLRLSREGIVRRVKEGLSFVCRARSVWQRVLYVARTASQSERWRVLA